MIVRTHQSEVRRRFIAAQPAPVVVPVERRCTHWRAHEIETLDRMLAEGKTFSQIARKIPGRTRCAIIGYDWRRRQG